PALLVDVPLARYGRLEGLPGDLRRVLGWAELFAHGLGVAIIGLTVFVLDRAHRRRLWRMFACAYGAGLAANLLKATLARKRPSVFDLTLGVQESFVGWFPTPADWDYSIQSFPSGHTAVAVALAMGLTRIYPHGKWLFFSFAGLAAAQRVAAGAHWLSDTVAAASLALLVAGLLCDRRMAGKVFDRIEQRGGGETRTQDETRP
ncbi:MAG: phosphatase PAP2 family protein, partial [Planctomycetes bacterium]|nr:phosphatase PAP2 family protein [Planctomycetota bacterium]